MRPRLAVLVVLVSLVSTAGCGRFASSEGDRRASESTTTVRYGSKVLVGDGTIKPEPDGPTAAGTGRTTTTTETAATARTAEATGAVDIRVVGLTGVARSGVPVQFTGPVTRTVTSDHDGHVRTPLPPGRYRAATVEGCVGQLVVRRGSGADLGVADGDTAKGELVAEVGPRFLPAAPVSYSGDATWRPGEVHVVRMRLTDACGATRPPSPAAYRSARFVANAAVEVIKPLSDEVSDDGVVQVALRCTGAEEDVSLDLVDVVDGAETTPVLTSALMEDQSRPFCVS